MRANAGFQPLHGYARRHAAVEPLPQRGARLVLGPTRDNGRSNALVGATEQLQVLLQGHPQTFDRGDVNRWRGAGQGRSKGLERRDARGYETPGAVPRASLRKEYRIRFRRLRCRRVQGRWISWAVEARTVQPGVVQVMLERRQVVPDSAMRIQWM